LSSKRFELFDPFAASEALSPRIAITLDHGTVICGYYALRQA
jgi:hypothetical protein